ncbi:MAG: DUF3352 domain-containing protein [Phycisphaerales bacterium]
MIHVTKANPMRKGRKIHSASIVLCTLFFMVLCTSLSFGVQNLDDAAKLIPPETVLLIDIDDFSHLRRQFEKTSFYKFYKDPAMAPFVNNLKTKLQEKLQEEDDELLDIIFNKEVLPEGRVTFALVINEQIKDSNDPPLLLLTQWGQNTNRIKELIDKMVKEDVEDGFYRQSTNYRGVDIITIGPKPSDSVSYCFTDDYLIGAANQDLIKFTIAHIKGADSPTLANDSDYTATMRTIKSSTNGQIDVYVNIKQIIKMAIAEDPTDKVKTTISNIGVDNVASLGYSIGLGDSPQSSGIDLFGTIFLKVTGPKKGICKMLDLESASFRPPRFIPNSAYSVSFVNLNIRKAFETLGNILNSMSPQFGAIMYMPIIPSGPQGEPPLLLKDDIIDHLGSQIIISQSTGESTSNINTPMSGQSLFALKINNRNALEKSMSILHSKALAANNPDAKRQLLGYTIYLVDMPTLFPPFMRQPKRPMQITGTSETPKAPKLAFTVTDTHLIISTEPAVEKAIRTLNSTGMVSLDSAKWFNRAKSIIPSAVGVATLENNADAIEILWSGLRNLKKQTGESKNANPDVQIGVGARPGSPLPHLMFSQTGEDLFDFGLLPEFDEIRKYFGLSASYGLSRPDGFFFEFKYLNSRGN